VANQTAEDAGQGKECQTRVQRRTFRVAAPRARVSRPTHTDHEISSNDDVFSMIIINDNELAEFSG